MHGKKSSTSTLVNYGEVGVRGERAREIARINKRSKENRREINKYK